MATTITKLADFIDRTNFEDIPERVIHETKRLLLDSIGCALAGVTADKGKWGVEYVRSLYGGAPQATILGLGEKTCAAGAAFANGESINALDYDASGKHLPPFVVPPARAAAEMNRSSGKDLITACALAFEVGMRVGMALGSYRDVKDGKTSLPPVTGHSSAVFGGATGVAKLERFSSGQTAQALGLAGLISPVQTQSIMHKDLPTNTGKYLMAGWAAQTSITAPYLVKAGHRGDVSVLDGEYGYWRFSGASRWDPDAVVDSMGEKWRFITKIPIKQYPCCRMMHGGLDCLKAILEENHLRHDEIESIHAYLEATCVEPVFHSPYMENQLDLQFNVAYNMSVMAFGLKPGARWQDYETMNNPEIRAFMEKVTFEPHPSYVNALEKNVDARISAVEVKARGQVFQAERSIIKGTVTDDPSTSFSDEELIAKFKDNASRILPAGKADEACRLLMDLEQVDDVTKVIEQLCL